jgi:protein-arginine kinase activator protein McsA
MICKYCNEEIGDGIDQETCYKKQTHRKIINRALGCAAVYRLIDAAYYTADIVKCHQCEYNFTEGRWCRVVAESLDPNLCPITQAD